MCAPKIGIRMLLAALCNCLKLEMTQMRITVKWLSQWWQIRSTDFYSAVRLNALFLHARE